MRKKTLLKTLIILTFVSSGFAIALTLFTSITFNAIHLPGSNGQVGFRTNNDDFSPNGVNQVIAEIELYNGDSVPRTIPMSINFAGTESTDLTCDLNQDYDVQTVTFSDNSNGVFDAEQGIVIPAKTARGISVTIDLHPEHCDLNLVALIEI